MVPDLPLDTEYPNWAQCACAPVPKLQQDVSISHFLFVDSQHPAPALSLDNECTSDLPSFVTSSASSTNSPPYNHAPEDIIHSLIDSISQLSTTAHSNIHRTSSVDKCDFSPDLSDDPVSSRRIGATEQNTNVHQIGWISNSASQAHERSWSHIPVQKEYEQSPGIGASENESMLHPVLHRKKSRQSLRQGLHSNDALNSAVQHSRSDSPVGFITSDSTRRIGVSKTIEARNSSSDLIKDKSASSEQPVSFIQRLTLVRSGSSLGLKGKTTANATPQTETTASRSSIPQYSPSGTLQSTSPLNPVIRDNLDNHLIPSRRSSMGYTANHGETIRSSVPIDLDPELLEENNATVRRIRELQEAREQRQKEWRREARRSEKAAKRLSLPSPKSSQKSHSVRDSRHSIVDTLPETPEQEEIAVFPSNAKAADTVSVVYRLDSVEAPVKQEQLSAPNTSANRRARIVDRSLTTYSEIKSNLSPEVKAVSRSASSRIGTPTTSQKTVAQEVDNFLAAPRLTQKIRHPRTARTIAFSDVGDPNGFAVFCCVGMGLTRYLTVFYDELAKTLRLRLITPDRPGVGESDPCQDGTNTPLGWVDDVAVICNALSITRFSLLAHSAGAIYAMAIALRMPQFVRGRIHLLAPWIPPSQMLTASVWGSGAQANLPLSHRLLNVLPTQLLKAANSRFLSSASAGLDYKARKSQKTRSSVDPESSILYDDLDASSSMLSLTSIGDNQSIDYFPPQSRERSCYQANNNTLISQGVLARPSSPKQSMYAASIASSHRSNSVLRHSTPQVSPEERKKLFNTALTHRIWQLATLNANPAGDLLVCLERRKPIGFRYAEITRSVVIHHGSKDGRVPVDNVRWLSSVMRRCELRVLENEGHGLMANAAVMAGVLGEICREWDEWDRIARNKQKKTRKDSVGLSDVEMNA